MSTASAPDSREHQSALLEAKIAALDEQIRGAAGTDKINLLDSQASLLSELRALGVAEAAPRLRDTKMALLEAKIAALASQQARASDVAALTQLLDSQALLFDELRAQGAAADDVAQRQITNKIQLLQMQISARNKVVVGAPDQADKAKHLDSQASLLNALHGRGVAPRQGAWGGIHELAGATDGSHRLQSLLAWAGCDVQHPSALVLALLNAVQLALAIALWSRLGFEDVASNGWWRATEFVSIFLAEANWRTARFALHSWRRLLVCLCVCSPTVLVALFLYGQKAP